MAQRVAVCPRCPQLVENRTQPVFGRGNPSAELYLVGEAPGKEEDARGTPFVGPAGRVLDELLQSAGFCRDEVYVCNTIKCRPPDNRPPRAEEITNCRPYFDEQLEIIRPRLLCALGTVAAHALLETRASLVRLRGRFHEHRGIPLLCTYHPAYVRRSPSARRPAEEDMKLLAERLRGGA
ncbi:MAG: uracil-DNA glycosylase [Pirellulales bacterium]